MLQSLKKALVLLYAIPLMLLVAVTPSNAEIIGTLNALEATQRQRDLATVSQAMAREDVRAQLEEWGVAEEDVDARLAALTDSELRDMAERIESMPAGAGVIEVIGIVFIVLLILELVGVIDIFKKIP